MANNAHRNVSVDITGNSDDLSRAYDDAMRKSKQFSDEEEKNRKRDEDGMKSRAWATKSALADMGGNFKSLGLTAEAIFLGIYAGIAVLGPASVAVAGLITLAFGAAFASIGIVAAAQHPVIRGEFSELWDDIKNDVADISKPFEKALLELPDIWRGVFSTFRPEMESSFGKLGPVLETFFERFSTGFAALAPSIGPLSDGLSALLDSLGLQAPAIFGHFSDAIISLADTATRHADDFAAMLQGIFAFVSSTAEVIGVLATEWNGLLAHVEGALKSVANGAWTVADLDNSNAAWQRITATLTTTIGQINNVATSMADATVSASALKDELNELSGVHVSADRAALTYATQLDQLTGAEFRSTEGIALNTVQGRKNYDLFLKLIEKSHSYINAKADEGVTVSQLGGIYDTHQSDLREAARNLGVSEEKAKDLINRYLKIPKSIDTKIGADTSGAQSAVDNFVTLNSGRRIPIDVYNRNAQLASGGMVGRDGYASGGPLRGPGGSRTDSIPINASRGEFIMNASATRRHLPQLESMNSGRGMGVGGRTVVYNINTSVAPTANLAAVGGVVVEAIQSYEQRSGKSWRNN
jgi:hypothetical protein